MEITPYPADPRYGATPDGRVFRIVRARFGKPVPHEMVQTVGVKGYLYVGNGSGKGLRTVRVHQVIARTFIPNPENLPEVAHKNGVKLDNRAENLRWSTTLDNQWDRLKHGTHNRGTRQTNHKLTESDVEAMRTGKMSPQQAASKSGAGEKHCYYVSRGKDWPHVNPR